MVGDWLGFFGRGLLIGFSIAAPVGPIGVLCIRRTLAYGRMAGFISGLGAATADAVYGSIAGFGLTMVSNALVEAQGWLRVIGGGFLLYLGIKIFLSKPSREQKGADTRYSLFGGYVSTFFLTLTNPITILSFTAIFAGLGIGSSGEGYPAALALMTGIFTGSVCWWWILSLLASLAHIQDHSAALQWINWLSGSIILFFGILALLTSINLWRA